MDKAKLPGLVHIGGVNTTADKRKLLVLSMSAVSTSYKTISPPITPVMNVLQLHTLGQVHAMAPQTCTANSAQMAGCSQ